MPRMSDRPGLSLRAFSLAICVFSATTIDFASAQTWPTRPITAIVPHAPAGGVDNAARIIADKMKDILGQTVVIENVPAAAGVVGVAKAARAAPDGYTIMFGDQTSFVMSSAATKTDYDIVADFQPIGLLTTSAGVLVGRASLPYRDARELVAGLKQSPDSLTIATFGRGSGPHINAIVFQKMTGTKLRIVPYRGVGPAMQDLVAGHVDLGIAEVSGAIGHVRAGAIKAFGVLAEKRAANAPEIPTIDELGGPPQRLVTWRGLMVPKGTPAPIVERLNAAVVAALADPATQKRILDAGQEVAARESQTPAALATHLKSEIARWTPIVIEANAAPDP